MNIGKAIGFGALLWAFIFVWTSILMFAFGIASAEPLTVIPLIIHLVLLIVISALLGKAYYKDGDNVNGFALGILWIIVVVVLDLIISVPLFFLPNGENYVTYFSSLWLWIELALIILVTGLTKEIIRK